MTECDMLLSILYIIGGAALVLLGADKLTDGAVAVAERMRVPQLVIGLTIVAIGTSMPEFCVSLVSALKDTPDLSVGNVVGSNIFNALLIVGVAAMVSPIIIQPVTVRKDIPFALVASALMMIMCFDGFLSRIDSAILFILFIIFMVLTLRGALAAKASGEAVATAESVATEEKAATMAGGRDTLGDDGGTGLLCAVGAVRPRDAAGAHPAPFPQQRYRAATSL